MDIQRLRNLTTGFLHTKIEDIHEDVEFITNTPGIMTHMLPNAFTAMQPWLKSKIAEPRYWNESFDTSHTGNIEIQPMNKEEQEEFFARYTALPLSWQKL